MSATAHEDDVPMRRDRDGSWIRDEPPHRCWKGWTGQDAQGRPVPCLRCRPHLVKAPRTPEEDPLEEFTRS